MRIKPGLPVIFFMIFILIAGCNSDSDNHQKAGNDHDHDSMLKENDTKYACPMLCVISEKAGPCPVCGMEMTEVQVTADEKSELISFQLSDHARKIGKVKTTTVDRALLYKSIVLPGKIKYDTTKVASVRSRVNGRIEKVIHGVEGVEVKKGDPLYEIYSPELLSAQDELLALIGSSTRSGAASAVREKLIQWGLSREQVDKLQKNRRSQSVVTILSPATGIITDLTIKEGDYVKESTPLYEITDLNSLWADFEAYDEELSLLKSGIHAIVSPLKSSGPEKTGKITFISPVTDRTKLTTIVRIEIENKDGSFRPGQPVLARAKARITSKEGENPLVIPHTAPLITGKRAIVYRMIDSETEANLFSPVQIDLGRKGDEGYEVQGGLSEGDIIIARGAFYLDSSLQISGQPGMMGTVSSDD